MRRPPPLTAGQKTLLNIYESELRTLAKYGAFTKAKAVAAKIQKSLKRTGHDMRWFQSLNWLAECAITAGEISFAKLRLESIRTIASENTRTHLEASTLLAICYLRENDFDRAKPLLRYVIRNDKVIKSRSRRTKFRVQFVERIEDESILAGLRSNQAADYSAGHIQEEAIKLLAFDVPTLVNRIGDQTPSQSIQLLEAHKSYAAALLPAAERPLLTSPDQDKKPSEVGNKTIRALIRITWQVLCNPNGMVYPLWSKGLPKIYNDGTIVTLLVEALTQSGIVRKFLVISFVAWALKVGFTKFCEINAPTSVLITLQEK